MLKRVLVAALVFVVLNHSSVNAQKAGDRRLDKYQVAAGSFLQARLITPVDSASARVNDQVDARLVDAVTQDGNELVPAGSVILGKVVSVAPASRKNMLGQVTVAFAVIEHAGTGSRAAIETDGIVFRASPEQPTAQDQRGRKKPVPVDVKADVTQLVTVRLAEPLIVYLPK